MSLINYITHTLLVVSLLSGTTACRETTGEQTHEESDHPHEEAPVDLVELSDDQMRMADITLGTVGYRNLGHQLNVNGRLAVPPQSQVTVTALQGGFIRAIPLLPGQPVRKGQVLARIENPDLIALQQEYAENHSRLTYLQTELVRQQELSRENVSALKVLQQTTADLNATRARVMGLAQRIRLVGLSPEAALAGKFSSVYVVNAPVAGVVTDVMTTAGQYVQPADLIAKLTSSQGLYAELIVFEKDLPQLREGQRISIRLTNETQERTGRILYINRAIDTDRSVRVAAKLDQADSRLTPNTFLKATLDLGASRTTALPEEAIVSAEGKEYIFVVTDEKIPEHHEPETGKPDHNEHDQDKTETHEHGTVFKQIPVRRGVTESGYSQVTLPGKFNLSTTKVVTKGAYALLSQLKAAGGEEEGHAH